MFLAKYRKSMQLKGRAKSVGTSKAKKLIRELKGGRGHGISTNNNAVINTIRKDSTNISHVT